MLPTWIRHVSTLSVFLPGLVFIYRFRQLSTDLKALAILFIFASVVEAITFITSQLLINNLWILNIFTLAEAFVYMFITGRWFNSDRAFKTVMILFILYAANWSYTTFVNSSIMVFNDKDITIEALLLILLSGILLIRLAKNEEIVIVSDYRLWILFAIFFYFSLSLIIFATSTYLMEDQRQAMHYSWFIHSIINIISNLLFTYGFICYYRKVNLSS